MYQVCTCPQSNLTSGDPHCSVHGKPSIPITYSWCEACSAKDAELSRLRGIAENEKGLLDIIKRDETEMARLRKVVEAAKAYVDKINVRLGNAFGHMGYCLDIDFGEWCECGLEQVRQTLREVDAE